MDFMERMRRKERALDEKLKWLKDQGNDRASARNSMIASNEVADELGVFEHDGEADDPTFDDERQKSFIIRTRLDAMEARMNAAQALDALNRVEAKLGRTELLLGITAGLVIGIALSQFF